MESMGGFAPIGDEARSLFARLFLGMACRIRKFGSGSHLGTLQSDRAGSSKDDSSWTDMSRRTGMPSVMGCHSQVASQSSDCGDRTKSEPSWL